MVSNGYFASDANHLFPFRPWVRRAGLSIVLAAAAITAVLLGALLFDPSFRFGWIGERFVWIYIGTLWIGGAKVWLGTWRPVAEANADILVLRPIHQFRGKSIPWKAISGTEQMIGGDRLVVYFDTPKGMRFVALNLNLIKGRRDFVTLLERRLRELGHVEKIVERSRYLSRPS
ncbi:MAG TPA: hypothetical protein VGF69_00305 [Thermoanaerobaculia bacterium]